MTAKPIIVTLSIAKVESGGNTGQGKYFYSFDRNAILITEANTPVTFQLAPETAASFSINTIISSDSTNQLDFPLRGPDPDPRSFLIVARCAEKALFSLAIIVDHAHPEKQESLLVCDPQVICVPTRPPVA
jgi:hypothetical protein